jgi:glutaredoxin
LYFEQNDIQYVEVDITRDRTAAARVRTWANGNETTPTFNIKGQIVVDFNIPKLEAALGLKQ